MLDWTVTGIGHQRAVFRLRFNQRRSSTLLHTFSSAVSCAVLQCPPYELQMSIDHCPVNPFRQ